jgi:Holliday junction DNA helicase RuvA
MIAGLVGKVAGKAADAALIDVNGVIYRVGTSTTTLADLGPEGETVRLHTYLLVREDQLALYGFASEDELELFETLISVTGIGPKLGCAILSRLPVDELRNAIQAGNADLLATVPGVGKKTAARLVVDLRGKLPSVYSGVPGRMLRSDDAEAVEALRSLGYTVAEASDAVARIEVAEDAPVEDRVVAALRLLSSS